MANIDDIEDDTLESVVIPPLGEVLAEARVAKKLTQKDASDFLRYSVAQVNALENNQLDVLPQVMITRGFIRNYARYLELDAEPLLASYKLRVPNTTPNTVLVGKSDRQIMLSKESQPWLKYILGSIVLLLFLLTWLISVEYMPKDFFQNQADDKTTVGLVESAVQALPQLADGLVSLPVEAVTLNGVQENTGESGLADNAAEALANKPPAQEISSQPLDDINALTATTTKTEALVSVPSVNAPSTNAALLAAASQSTAAKTSITNGASNGAINPMIANNKPTTTSVAAVKQTTNSGLEKAFASPGANLNAVSNQYVNLSFSEQTWIQVTDKNGVIVYEKMLAAGAQESIGGPKPLTLIIGNAKATKLSFMGKSVDLKPYTTENNVARVRLE